MSPYGSGYYFHAQKPPTLCPVPGGQYDQWVADHQTGWELIAPPAMECAGNVAFRGSKAIASAGDATDGFISVRWLAQYWHYPDVPKWDFDVDSYEWDSKMDMWKHERAQCWSDSGFSVPIPTTVEACASHALISARTILAMGRSSRAYKYSVSYENVDVGSCSVETGTFRFKYNELEVFQQLVDLDYWDPAYRNIAGNAYIDAACNLPRTSNNSLQNLIEVIDGVKSLASGNLGKSAVDFVRSNAFSKAKNAWLAYRYSYNTTKMDLQEYKSLYSRLANLHQTGNFVTRGQFRFGGIFARCSFKVPISSVIPHDFEEFMHTSGFYLKAADVWDDIPFSFIVDWFVQLGDILSHFDDAGQAAEVRPADVWYSFTTSYDDQIIYFRVPGEPIWNVPFLDWNTGTSTKVSAMRIADTISLFT